jgi:hypothetical protein
MGAVEASMTGDMAVRCYAMPKWKTKVTNWYPRDYVVESIKAEIELSTPSRRRRIFEAIALAALASIPWVGGVIAAPSKAIGQYRDGESQSQRDELLTEWLQGRVTR